MEIIVQENSNKVKFHYEIHRLISFNLTWILIYNPTHVHNCYNTLNLKVVPYTNLKTKLLLQANKFKRNRSCLAI